MSGEEKNKMNKNNERENQMKDVILLHSHYDNENLEKVKTDMATLGSPVIHAVWQPCWNAWVALEGCHRLRAAVELGIPVEIAEVEYSDELMADFSWCDLDNDCTVAELVDEGAHRYNDGCFVTVETEE